MGEKGHKERIRLKEGKGCQEEHQKSTQLRIRKIVIWNVLTESTERGDYKRVNRGIG